MKLTKVTPTTIKKSNSKEVISLHRRVHQLYGVAKKRDYKQEDFYNFLTKVHTTLANEIDRRGMNHNSPLTLSVSLKYLKG